MRQEISLPISVQTVEEKEEPTDLLGISKNC